MYALASERPSRSGQGVDRLADVASRVGAGQSPARRLRGGALPRRPSQIPVVRAALLRSTSETGRLNDAGYGGLAAHASDALTDAGPTDAGPTDAGPTDAGAADANGGAPPPPAACPHPINWNHTAASDNGPDGIQIPITWQSSTGSLADLSNCTVREVVTYDPIPNPPFTWNPPNPTILTVPAVNGAGQDTHSYPPGLMNGITNPRAPGTMVAHQQYQFRCTGPGCSGNWEGFPGQAYTITREVFAQFARTNPWRYRITKDGVGNLFRYSREVDVPEPPAAPGPAPGTGPGP